MRILIYMVAFAMFGVALESLWTGLLDSIKDRNPRLKTRASIWMFPIYAMLVFIVIFVQWLYHDYPWWLRGAIYAMLIIGWEYLSGSIIKLIVGVAPWDYSTDRTYDGIGSKKRFRINDIICLEYVPLWFFCGLAAELLFFFLENHLCI